MAFVWRESFPVRGNEIGFTGVVSPSTIARYCEHVRWGAFRQEALRAKLEIPSGVARAVTIEFVSDFTYPGEVVVTSWVARVGRTSLDFAHELARPDGSIVATVRTTIVALGREGPVPLPAELASAVDPRPAPTPLALPVAAPSNAYLSEWVVRPSDQDRFRHVNQAKYIDFADDARYVAAQAKHAAGFDGPIGKLTVSYERELHGGEPASLRLWAPDGVTRHVELRHGASGTVVNRAVLVPRGEL